MELQTKEDVLSFLQNLHVRIFNKMKGKGLGILESLELPDEKLKLAKEQYLIHIDTISNDIIRFTKKATEILK